MSAVCLIDTSVFLNLMDVPGKNQDKASVIGSFRVYVELDTTFILPMATILETGNHIVQNGDGQMRREAARRSVAAVKGACEGTAPWRPNRFPETDEMLGWIDQFPDAAMRNKAADKPYEGTSFGDLSIIKEYEKCCRRYAMTEVFMLVPGSGSAGLPTCCEQKGSTVASQSRAVLPEKRR